MIRPGSTWLLLSSLLLACPGSARAASSPDPAAAAGGLVRQMTLDEKLSLVDGGGHSDARCVGATPGIMRLGIPPLCMGDGPAGVGNGLHSVTMFPAPIALAAGWNTELATAYGAAQAEEQQGKGRNVALLPTLNILRSPLWGRAAETLGEDPVLTAQLGTAIIRGVQSRHVIAMPKHFAANNQETERFGDGPDWPAVDAVVSERTLREIYLPAFEAAVTTAGAQSIMCAYNRVNGVYACENRQLLDILRNEWNFTGFVTSDWLFAGRSTLASIRAGQDQLMPGGQNPYGLPDYYGEPLRQALKSGLVPAGDLDRMVGHILDAILRVGVTAPLPGASGTDVRTDVHASLARTVAGDGIVLLKNDAQLLPITGRDRRIAIIGPDADSQAQVTETYGGFVPPDPQHPLLTPLQAIRHRAFGRQVVYAAGTAGIQPLPPLPDASLDAPDGKGTGWTVRSFASRDGNGPALQQHDGVHGLDVAALMTAGARSARWDGSIMPTETGEYRVSIAGGGAATITIEGRAIATYTGEEFNTVAHGSVRLVAGHRVRIGVSYDAGTAILPKKLSLGWAPPSRLRAAAAAVAAHADIAIVFVSDIASEGADRTSLALPGDQDALIEAVAAANPRTVVVLNTVGPVLTPWRHHVAGLVEAWYAGEADGSAITDVLFGDRDPSGRLPETFPAQAGQGATAIGPAVFPGIGLRVRYDENLLVGYRYFDAHHQEPAFPFGYGLSYTSFALSGLHADAPRSVSVDLADTGSRAASSVVQLYVEYPAASGEPLRQLKAFQKIALRAGGHRRLRFVIDDAMLRTWNTVKHAWQIPPGRYRIHVGFSSRDLPVSTTIDVKS